MRLRRVMKVVATALALGGCVVQTPLSGPGYDAREGVTATGEGPLVLSLTAAVLKDDDTARDRFWAYVDTVEASLPGRPGLVAYAKRTELFGDTAWTMTVWTDRDSLRAFVDSEPHRNAMRAAFGALSDARFARVEIDRNDLPVSWDRALELLESDGRHYYE